MSSDHWNFLANLLGTPGPAEKPGAQKNEKSPKNSDPEQEDAAESKSVAADSDDSEVADTSPEISLTGDDQPKVEERVLDALTASVPRETLPGFGNSAVDPELDQLTDGAPPAEDEPIVEELLERDTTQSASDEFFADADPIERPTLDETIGAPVAETESGDDDQSESQPDTPVDDGAWDSLAGELGVDPANDLPPHREPQVIEKREPKSTGSRKRKGTGGFGIGLGMDLGTEPEAQPELVDESDDEPDVDPIGEVADGATENQDDDDLPSWSVEASDERSDDDATDVETSSDPLAFSSFSDFEDDEPFADDDANEVEVVSRDSWNNPPQRGGLGARGSDKQRARRDDRDKESHSFRTARDPDDEPSRGRRRRRGVRQRGDDPVESQSDQSIVNESDDDRENDRGKRRQSRDDDDRSNDKRRKSRRRGRKGRSRSGRLEDDRPLEEATDYSIDGDLDDDDVDGQDVEASDDGEDESEDRPRRRRKRGRRGRGGRGRNHRDQDRSAENKDDADDIGWDNDEPPQSAFDDDHEDDDEVEVIRKGRRRGRGRDRDDDRDSDCKSKKSSRDREDAPKRKPVPTWSEVVGILVDNNIKNHQKGGKRGGKKRRGGNKD